MEIIGLQLTLARDWVNHIFITWVMPKLPGSRCRPNAGKTVDWSICLYCGCVKIRVSGNHLLKYWWDP